MLDLAYFFLLSSLWVLCFVTTGSAVLITDSGSLWILASWAVPELTGFSPSGSVFPLCVPGSSAPDLRVVGVWYSCPGSVIGNTPVLLVRVCRETPSNGQLSSAARRVPVCGWVSGQPAVATWKVGVGEALSSARRSLAPTKGSSESQ